MARVVVTGGAGFIGSCLIDSLLGNGNEVEAIDNLTSGSLQNLSRALEDPRFKFTRGDVSRPDDVERLSKCQLLFHFAGNSNVRTGSDGPSVHFEQNVKATYILLEAARKADPETFIFASTSTVYGEPERIPTSEGYGPPRPISTYGASKLAGESLICSYASTYGFGAVIFRLANVVGARCKRGVVYDFVRKLQQNQDELEVLGDGRQEKSYLHVTDSVAAIIAGLEAPRQRIEIFNVGSEDRTSVTRIADIVCEEIGLQGVQRKFRPATPDGRGWPGDIKTMQLDISKLKSRGWKPRMNSEQAIRQTVMELMSVEQVIPARSVRMRC